MVYGIEQPQAKPPPVVLFGYDCKCLVENSIPLSSHSPASPFTNKVRVALRLKQIPFSYVTVPSMMPRPLLSKTFNISYRKIPILVIGRELYCDTSLIIEALEHFFSGPAYGTVYPKVRGALSWNYRSLARGFASFWADKPLFRTTTGLIPHTVWESAFGTDRAQLIGHRLDPQKLRAKVPQNLAAFDLHLSLLETGFNGGESAWAFPTKSPSLADVSLYYQIRWGIDIAAGKGIDNLTGGGTQDTGTDATASMWNEERYPGLWRWFHTFETHISSLPDTETAVAEGDEGWVEMLKKAEFWEEDVLVPAAAPPHTSLDEQSGLKRGVVVSVAPDDTGRDNPTVGKLVAIGVEEVVIEPLEEGKFKVRIHFPRLGFVIKVLDGERAKL